MTESVCVYTSFPETCMCFPGKVETNGSMRFNCSQSKQDGHRLSADIGDLDMNSNSESGTKTGQHGGVRCRHHTLTDLVYLLIAKHSSTQGPFFYCLSAHATQTRSLDTCKHGLYRDVAPSRYLVAYLMRQIPLRYPRATLAREQTTDG